MIFFEHVPGPARTIERPRRPGGQVAVGGNAQAVVGRRQPAQRQACDHPRADYPRHHRHRDPGAVRDRIHSSVVGSDPEGVDLQPLVGAATGHVNPVFLGQLHEGPGADCDGDQVGGTQAGSPPPQAHDLVVDEVQLKGGGKQQQPCPLVRNAEDRHPHQSVVEQRPADPDCRRIAPVADHGVVGEREVVGIEGLVEVLIPIKRCPGQSAEQGPIDHVGQHGCGDAGQRIAQDEQRHPQAQGEDHDDHHLGHWASSAAIRPPSAAGPIAASTPRGLRRPRSTIRRARHSTQ